MLLDYNSLLLAIGFSAACLAITLFVSWLAARSDGFLLTWAVGAALIVAHVFTYSAHVAQPSRALSLLAGGFFISGMAVIYVASRQFRTGIFSWRFLLAVLVPPLGLTLLPMLLGYDGLGYILWNASATVMMFATAREYWRGRDEAPQPIAVLTLLYIATGISFALCGGVLLWNRSWVLGHAPDNWAEDLSLLIVIASMTGIGGLSLALSQWRAAGSHRRDALTDTLTGLPNRRALFEAHGGDVLAADTAVVVFDLDEFKEINDRFGHAIGDRVLTLFARAVSKNVRASDVAARLGGEEFALVLPDTRPDVAIIIADRIRTAFSESAKLVPEVELDCTVSAGVAFVGREGESFEKALRRADQALYLAKRDGRNRVTVHA